MNHQSENRTLPLLRFLDLDALVVGLWLVAGFFDLNRRVDGQVEDFLNAIVLLCAALDVRCSHSLRYRLALLWRDWCQALSSEEFDACSFVS